MRPILVSFASFKKLPKGQKWKTLGKALLVFCTAVLFLLVAVFAYFAKDLPSPGKINRRVIAESTKIFDRTGNHLLYEIHGEEKRTLIPFEEIPDVVKYSTIVIEDQDFYSHRGIKFSSILRAALKDVKKMSVAQGGSTITQQFIKNSVLTPERTFSRKIKEVILALEMELKFSKNEILGMYLNEIPYGSNAYGIESAAQTFFGKSAKNLGLDEAAMLAALPKAPTYFSPYGSHLDELKKRQELILKKMADLGYISREQEEEAKNSDVFSKLNAYRGKIEAPHFVMYVKEYLEFRYGKQLVEQGGLKVYTTLDWDKQQIAEKVVREGAVKNNQIWRAGNVALVAIDPKTGQILAMVGSKNYFGKSEPAGCFSGKNCVFEPQDNVTIRNRQPGSSFKPYVYFTAFAKGYTPETYLFDVKTNFGNKGDNKDYEPQNYDGKFRGPIKMKEALAQSLNIPAVETLYLAGVRESIATAKRFGITTLNQPDRYGLSLVLGGGEIKLIDHVSAFGTFATGGIRHQKTAVLRVEDGKGQVYENFLSGAGERVADEKYVAMINHILSTNDYRAPIFGENSPLRFDNRPVAVKTGTTNEFRDGWAIGYTPSIVVGVWAGNNDNSPMKAGADGVNVAAPIWRAFLDQVLTNYAVEKFSEYKEEKTGKPILDGKLDIEKDLKVCKIPGEEDKYCLANKYCQDVKKRSFVDSHTILYYVNKDDPRGEYPKEPQNDPQFRNWEKALKDWYKSRKNDYIFQEPPKEECKQEDFAKLLPQISLSLPQSVAEDFLNIKASVTAPYGVSKVEFYVNDEKIATVKNKPYEKLYIIPSEKRGSILKIRVEVVDNKGNTANDSGEVDVEAPVGP